MDQITVEEGILRDMWFLLESLREKKPQDRNEVARRYAVTITELEKVVSYFKTFVVDSDLRKGKG